MENQIQIFKNDYGGYARCYIDATGTAWINAEDSSRGLGFVMVRKERVTTSGDNYSAVRWERVNGYLKQFGYPKTVGKDDYIPENIFYRLAMKAKNETAEKFQAWIADEVIPSIRKTGSYSLPKIEKKVPTQKPLPEYHKIIKEIDKSAKQLVKCFGVKYGMAFAYVTSMVEDNHGFNFTSIKKLIPAAEHEIGRYNPTQIAKLVGLKSAQEVNKKLVELGLQEKNGDDGYILTEEGKKYGEAIPFNNNGHSGYQILWNDSLINLILK